MGFRCESVSFLLNANLENYFRNAIIHLTSRHVQFENLVLPPAKHHTTSQDELQRNIALALFTLCYSGDNYNLGQEW